MQHATGSTAREALTLVRVGALMHDAVLSAVESASAPGGAVDGAGDPPRPLATKPWLASVGAAVATGILSVAAAEAIRSGLGEPTQEVGVEALTAASTILLQRAAELNADQLFRNARILRDDLDVQGIATREHARQQKRSLRRYRNPDGMTRYTWDLDPEGAALVDGIYDQITSPRRGGPRFVDTREQARVDVIMSDPRTTEQLVSDMFLELLTIAVNTDPRQILGRHRPALTVLVTQADLARGRGSGHIEGQHDPISIETVERISCDAEITPIVFDACGQVVNLGRRQRLFGHRQRLALAARDGGCRWPDCERPPVWTEAHHIKQWHRDNGKTDLSNGILLCRHHHLLLHDNHWEIRGDGVDYWLVPPRSLDASQRPRPMPTKSPALRELLKLPA